MSLMQFGPFGDPFRQMDRLTSQLMSGTRTPIAMPMDVWRSGDGYHVDLDLPGVDPGTVEVTCEKNVLTVRADRQPEFGPDDEILVAERPQGGFSRQLQLGDAVDASSVQASYRNGVLCLTISMAEQEQPRRIQVQHGAGQQAVQITGETEESPAESSSEPSGDGGQDGGQQGQPGQG